ncbi:MAG: hypothetical protein ACR2GZ_11265 [Solirubrobacteraceae bacterium]
MTDPSAKRCIYPGCARPAVAPHPLGGPQPSFCDLEGHNALSAHQERQRRAAGEGHPCGAVDEEGIDR